MNTVQKSKPNIYDNLSILYAQYGDDNHFNQTILNSIFKKFHTSLDVEDTINKYKNFKEITGYFFDLLIIDNRLGLDICKKILKINPSQKIIVMVRLYESQNLSKFYVSGFDDFIYEPLSRPSIEKTISNLVQQDNQDNSITDKLNKQNEDLTSLITQCEIKLHKAKKDLEQRNEFFASMSHEIRTPMNAIIGMSQTLLDDNTLNREQLETAKTINSSSNMLLGIINDILDFSKIEAGKVSLERTSFDLNIILSYLSDMLRLKAQEKGLKLIFDIDHNIGKNYLGDSLRISQVLLNLLSNAIKFTNEGSVTLRVKTINTLEGKSTIEFEINDTGIGMTDQQLLNLFQSYSQASVETSRKYGGTGLGLSISKQLVEMMHGKIWVDSEQDKGTTFFVTLTLDTDSDKRKYRLPSKDIMQMKVLIMDSDLESVNSLTNLIKYFHMPIKSALSIGKAKQLIDQDNFDILIIDRAMYEQFDIESYKKKSKVHVVLIESWENVSMNEKVNYSVVDEILKKPFHQQMIFEIFSSLYNMKGIPNNKKQIDQYDKEDIKALGKHKILVAEDNIINQKVLNGLLANTELELEFADDGQKALNMLYNCSTPYKLILMDINMPNLDGYMATQKIRQKSDYDDVVIIGLSGYSDEEDIKKAKDIGMQDYLVKPINVKSLYEVLIKYLS